MASITDEEREEYRQAFAMFDKSNDGKITSEELGTVVRAMGKNPSKKEIKKMLNEVDTDGSGYVDFNEFCQMMTKRKSNGSEEDELKASFKVFDSDGNGFISESELRHIMTNLGEKLSQEEVEDMMKLADRNGDGFVAYDEFVAMIAPPPKKK